MALKLKFKTQFPAVVHAVSPILLTKTGFSYTFSLDQAAVVGTGVANHVAYYPTASSALSSSPYLVQGSTPFGSGAITGLTVVSTPSFNARNGTTIANGVGPDGSGGTIIFWAQNGTFAGPTAIINQQELGSVSAYGWTGSAWGPPAQNTGMIIASTEAWTPSANGAGILFQTTRNGTTAAINEVSIVNGVSVMTPGQFTKAGLGPGTLNAEAGVYDTSVRVVSGASPVIALTNANAFTVGQNGATNPAFRVDTATASSVTGISITSQAAAGGVSLTAISSTTNEPIAFNAKGSGQITIGNASTGPISLGRAIIYGGVTLANSVTGTGSMALSDSPTFTNVPLAPTAAAGTNTAQIATTAGIVAERAATKTLTNTTLNSTGTGNVLQVSGVTVSAGQYPGEPTTGSATAGNVGEYVESVITSGSAVSLVSGTSKTVTSITLSAGDWDVDAVLQYFPANTTSFTALTGSLSLTDNTSDVTPGRFFQVPQGTIVSNGTVTYSVGLPNYRFSRSGSTTIYIVANATFTVSTMTSFGIIRARRVR